MVLQKYNKHNYDYTSIASAAWINNLVELILKNTDEKNPHGMYHSPPRLKHISPSRLKVSGI